MKVFIGGKSQGKLTYVINKYGTDLRIAEGAEASLEECIRASVINHFHLYLKRHMADTDLHEQVDTICRSNPEVILICDEIGYGIVPIEPSERFYRETVGRIMCRMTANACHAERIICGIGQILKEANPHEDSLD